MLAIPAYHHLFKPLKTPHDLHFKLFRTISAVSRLEYSDKKIMKLKFGNLFVKKVKSLVKHECKWKVWISHSNRVHLLIGAVVLLLDSAQLQGSVFSYGHPATVPWSFFLLELLTIPHHNQRYFRGTV